MEQEWSWTTATEIKGKCPCCTDLVMHGQQLITWRNAVYHNGCLITFLIAFAPKPYAGGFYGAG